MTSLSIFLRVKNETQFSPRANLKKKSKSLWFYSVLLFLFDCFVFIIKTQWLRFPSLFAGVAFTEIRNSRIPKPQIYASVWKKMFTFPSLFVVFPRFLVREKSKLQIAKPRLTREACAYFKTWVCLLLIFTIRLIHPSDGSYRVYQGFGQA